MHEAETAPTLTSESQLDLAEAARRAGAWFGEPFVHDGEEVADALAPDTARRAALDHALEEMAAGLAEPSARWKVRYGLMLGLERVLTQEPVRTAAGTELRRHQVDALTGMLTELIASTQHGIDENGNGHGGGGNGSGNGVVAEAEIDEEVDDDFDAGFIDDGALETEFHGDDPGASRRYRFRHPTASGKTIAAAGFVDAARELGILILTHRRLLVSQFQNDLTTEGYGHRFSDAIMAGAKSAKDRPDHDPDVRVVRAPRLRARPHRVPPRALRRGSYGPRREDERGDPRVPRAALHRHDGDGAPDREAGLRRLPGFRRRPPARGRREARPHRAAPRPPRASRGRCELRPDRRRRLRGARAGSGSRPPGAEPGGGEPLPRPLRIDSRASSTRPASSTRTTSRRSSAPPVSRPRPSRAARLRRSSPRHSPPTSAARSTS